MIREEFEKIMDGDSCLENYEQENTLLGLNIIAKYLPKSGVEYAEHDIIFACMVDKILEAGLTKEDAIELRNLNWMIDDESEGLACYV